MDAQMLYVMGYAMAVWYVIPGLILLLLVGIVTYFTARAATRKELNRRFGNAPSKAESSSEKH